MIRVDLGCGGSKEEGFLGVDRFGMGGVDIIADLDLPLPFESDSVDLLVASHSLEHVCDLMATMQEVYRICKHGAQVCIVAPYSEQKLNIANPYHNAVFNEHTPRFWTESPAVNVDEAEYAHPHAHSWGLARSDHSDPGLDLRLFRMEFFYFPEYRNFPREVQRRLRRERVDVCDQILYNLVVWKDAEASASFAETVELLVPYEPDYVRLRRLTEQTVLLSERTRERDAALETQRRLEGEVGEKSRLLDGYERDRGELARLRYECERSEARAHQVSTDNHALRQQIAELYQRIEQSGTQHLAQGAEVARLSAEAELRSEWLDEQRAENGRLRSQLELREEHGRQLMEAQARSERELASAREREDMLVRECSALRTRLESQDLIKAQAKLVRAELEATNGMLSWYRGKELSWKTESAALAAKLDSAQRETTERELVVDEARGVLGDFHAELSARRKSRTERVLSIFQRPDMLWDMVSPAFGALKDFTARYFRRSGAARLVLSDDLRQIPYREYVVPFHVERLSSIELAIRPLLRTARGVVGVEIVSDAGRIVAQVSVPVRGVSPDVPTAFALPAPVMSLGAGWAIRVFCRDVDAPLAVHELVEYSTFRRRLRHVPFALLADR